MKRSNACAIAAIPILSIGNLVHLPMLFWLLSEQIKTGFGAGTSIELGALIVWLLEIACIPFFLSGAVLLLISIFKKAAVPLIAVNLSLVLLLVLQVALTNAFMYI